MTKVLVSDPIDQAGIDILAQVAQVDQRVGLSEDDLKAMIGDYDALMIRSGTQVTADVIKAGARLRIIGRAGVGVDNVDVPTATPTGCFGGEFAGRQHDCCCRTSVGFNAFALSACASGPCQHDGWGLGSQEICRERAL